MHSAALLEYRARLPGRRSKVAMDEVDEPEGEVKELD